MYRSRPSGTADPLGLPARFLPYLLKLPLCKALMIDIGSMQDIVWWLAHGERSRALHSPVLSFLLSIRQASWSSPGKVQYLTFPFPTRAHRVDVHRKVTSLVHLRYALWCRLQSSIEVQRAVRTLIGTRHLMRYITAIDWFGITVLYDTTLLSAFRLR